MVTGPMRIVSGFPAPPSQVRQALSTLAVLRGGDADAIAELGDIADLPRPWDPATCPGTLRQQVWLWCDDVAGWINRQYSWRPASLIPACWPRHPHIAGELPVLACLRDAAGGTGPELLEEWHQRTLPLFLDRLATRLGESTCRTGKHQDWPAAGRHDSYTNQEASTERHDLFHADTHPPVRLRPVGTDRRMTESIL
jgi:hypothetical protein